MPDPPTVKIELATLFETADGLRIVSCLKDVDSRTVTNRPASGEPNLLELLGGLRRELEELMPGDSGSSPPDRREPSPVPGGFEDWLETVRSCLDDLRLFRSAARNPGSVAWARRMDRGTLVSLLTEAAISQVRWSTRIADTRRRLESSS